MKKVVTNEQLVDLVNGVDPYYNVFEVPLVKENGYYTGGFHDKWNWYKDRLEKLSENQLWELYHICKNSWL